MQILLFFITGIPQHMRKLFVFAALLFAVHIAAAQQKKSYADSLKAFQVNYVNTHEIVKEADRKYFSFYPVDALYSVPATVTPLMILQVFRWQHLQVRTSCILSMRCSALS